MQHIIQKTVYIDKDELIELQTIEHDIKTRFVNFKFISNNKVIDLSNCKVRIYAKNPKNNEVFNDLNIIEAKKGIAQLELTDGLLVPGITEYQLKIMPSDGGRLSSKAMRIIVDKDLMSAGSIESTNEFIALDSALKKADDYNKELESATAGLEFKYADRLNEVDSQLSEFANNKRNPINLLSKCLQRLSKKEQIKIVCQGDSMTYGQDTISSDKRPADSAQTDNGSRHTHERAGVTYPEALKSYLDEIYPTTNHTVINKGYSGDWVEGGFKRWNKNDNADIALIMYGTNDADLVADWVPENVRGNIDKFINDYRTLIERYLKWGTAVVILTPPKQYNQENGVSGRLTESYRNALFLLGSEYNIPVIDTEEFSNGWNKSFYCDGTHFNTKGNKAFASRLAACLIGFGLQDIERVKLFCGEDLSVRTTRDNFVSNGCSFELSENSSGAEEGENSNILAGLKSGNSLFYSIFTSEDNTLLIPSYTCWNSKKMKITVDFKNEQGSVPLSTSLANIEAGYRPKTEYIFSSSSLKNWLLDNSINIENKDGFIWLANKGWHVIKVEVNESDAIENSIAINGFSVISYRDLALKRPKKLFNQGFLQKLLYPNWVSPTPTINKIEVTCKELNEIFEDNFLFSNEDYKAIPIKVQLHNSRVNIVESSFMWHDNNTGTAPTNGFYQGFYTNKIDLVSSPTNYRTITSITYDSTNRKYIINFGGNLNQLGSIVIKPL